ncbi:hypothetical protein [Acidicapsa acidisoli]|uniref:hypothetical protein n=1 Tax=Acidicapsa acidisoli TaxID=1615681 RepID=UPI0021DFCCE8|nr:hypothetical protein [Acidicapsa acidisoli]
MSLRLKDAARNAAGILLLLASIVNPCGAGYVDTTLAGRTISVDLIKASDLSPAPWPDGDFALTTEMITTQSTANIYDLLTANGIEPDVEAFTVVYDLNPSLNKIDPLSAGTRLVLPKANGGEKLRQALGSGFLISLTVDRALREELAKSTAELHDLSIRFDGLPAERFLNPSDKDVMTARIRTLAVWLAHAHKTYLQRTGPSLRRETLTGIHDEAQALNALLAVILKGREKVTPDDEEQVDAVYNDIQKQMKKYDNVMAGEPQPGDDQYKVVVSIRGGDARLVEGLQVYYAWEGLFRKPPKEPYKSQAFDGVGSGSSATLTIADYVIWAGKPGHPFPPLTDQKPISIGASGGNPRNVVLSVIQ